MNINRKEIEKFNDATDMLVAQENEHLIKIAELEDENVIRLEEHQEQGFFKKLKSSEEFFRFKKKQQEKKSTVRNMIKLSVNKRQVVRNKLIVQYIKSELENSLQIKKIVQLQTDKDTANKIFTYNNVLVSHSHNTLQKLCGAINDLYELTDQKNELTKIERDNIIFESYESLMKLHSEIETYISRVGQLASCGELRFAEYELNFIALEPNNAVLSIVDNMCLKPDTINSVKASIKTMKKLSFYLVRSLNNAKLVHESLINKLSTLKREECAALLDGLIDAGLAIGKVEFNQFVDNFHVVDTNVDTNEVA